MSVPRFKPGSICLIVESGRGECPEWIKQQFVGRVVTLKSSHWLDDAWYWQMIEPMVLVLYEPYTIRNGRTFGPGAHHDIVIREDNLKLIKGPDVDLSIDVEDFAHA